MARRTINYGNTPPNHWRYYIKNKKKKARWHSAQHLFFFFLCLPCPPITRKNDLSITTIPEHKIVPLSNHDLLYITQALDEHI